MLDLMQLYSLLAAVCASVGILEITMGISKSMNNFVKTYHQKKSVSSKLIVLGKENLDLQDAKLHSYIVHDTGD